MPSYYPVVLDADNVRLKESGVGDTLDTTDSILQTNILKIDGKVIQSINTINTSSNTINIAYSSFFQLDLSSTYSFATDGFQGADPTANVAQSFLIEINNAGSHAVVWPTNVVWTSGLAPTIYNNAVSVVTFMTTDNGTTFRGSLSLNTSA